MENQKKNNLPFIYSCSGCSNVAQLANDIAIKINFDGIAEMSCIAGVGGKVKSLVKKARSNRPIIVVDGCPLQCAKECLKNIDVEPHVHIVLTDHDLKKKNNVRLKLEERLDIIEHIIMKINNIQKTCRP